MFYPTKVDKFVEIKCAHLKLKWSQRECPCGFQPVRVIHNTNFASILDIFNFFKPFDKWNAIGGDFMEGFQKCVVFVGVEVISEMTLTLSHPHTLMLWYPYTHTWSNTLSWPCTLMFSHSHVLTLSQYGIISPTISFI